MRRYSSEELQELAAGYALGAASAEEAAAVEEAIAGSPALAAEVASYREVAVRLAQARAVAPSSAVRDRLMTRVRETPQRDARDARDAAVVPIAAARRSRTPVWLAAGLAASLLLAAGLAWQNAALRRSLDARGAEIAAATEKATRRERQLETVLEAEKDLYVAQMKSADTVAGPGIQFFWNEKKRVAMLHAFRLRPAPAGRSYQLWLVRDGAPVSAKVFNSDPDGHALVEDIAVPARAAGVTQVLLTEEPAGGSPQPTTTPFVGGVLAKT